MEPAPDLRPVLGRVVLDRRVRGGRELEAAYPVWYDVDTELNAVDGRGVAITRESLIVVILQESVQISKSFGSNSRQAHGET